MLSMSRVSSHLLNEAPPLYLSQIIQHLSAKKDMESDDDEVPVLVSTSAVAAPEDLPQCPVTILSGFLGSGKTTLIQHILTSPDHGKRIAVIENEFGEGLAIESLIARDGVDPNSNSLSDLIELPNGCICCTVKDSLVSTLENLLSKRHDLDYILIEASGMANPGPIASVFWLDDEIQSRLRLDGIVTMVDSHNILRQLEETEEAMQQIAYADRVILNKTDLLSDKKELDEITNTIRAIHPTAPLRSTSFSAIPDLTWILDADCFGGKERIDRLESDLYSAEEAPQLVHTVDEHVSTQHTSHNHHHDHGPPSECEQCTAGKASHTHTQSVSTISLRLSGSVDLNKINAWMADILWPNQDATDKELTELLQRTLKNDEAGKPNPRVSNTKGQQQTIFRVKGILSVRHGDESYENVDRSYLDCNGVDSRRYVVQAVHDLWDVTPASDSLQWEPELERSCRLVIIGKSLNKDILDTGFQDCAAR